MLTALAVILVAASPPPPAKVSTAGVSYVNLSDREGDAYVDSFANRLGRTGRLEVTTRTQVSQLLGAERQRQLLGCDTESTACLTELMGALGTNLLVTGSIGRLGTVLTVSLKLIDGGTTRQLAAGSGRFATEAELLEGLDRLADEFVRQLAPAARPVKGSVLGLGIAAGALAVGSAALFVVANAAQGRLLTESFPSAAALHDTASLGRGTWIGGWAAAGAAVVAAVVAVVLQWAVPESVALLSAGSNGAVVSW